MTTLIVQEANGVRYFEAEGARFESNELPPEGTEIEVECFTEVGDVPGANVEWVSPSCICCKESVRLTGF